MRARSGAVLAISLVVLGCTSAQPSASPMAGTSANPTAAPTEPPSVPPPSSASASPVPSEAALPAWQQVAAVTGGRVVGFAGGYVALDEQGDQSSVRFSSDGKTWTSEALPFAASTDPHGIALTATAQSIAADAAQVEVVGGYGHVPCTPQAAGSTGGGPECPSSPISWLSSDGIHWQSSYPWRGPGPAKGFKQGNEFSTVWAVPTGGWDAATDDIGGESGAAGGIFHSADGFSWTALPASPPTVIKGSPVPTELWHLGLAAQSGGRLVAGYWYPMNGASVGGVVAGLFTSPDGQAWSRITSFPGTLATVESGVAPDPSRAPLWIVAGSDAKSFPTVWTSPDLKVWTAHELPLGVGTDGALSAIAETSLGYVAAGTITNETTADVQHSSWLSTNGVDWVQLATPGTAGDDGPDVLADGPAGVIGFAEYNGSEVPPGAWLLK